MKHKTKNRKSRHQRSDIPYADRLLAQRYDSLREHRNDAAKTALKLACVALNETEGLGFVRLTRFARELRKLINEYYADPEVGEEHLNKRLEQLGFLVVDGKVMVLVEREQEEALDTNKFEEETGK